MTLEEEVRLRGAMDLRFLLAVLGMSSKAWQILRFTPAKADSTAVLASFDLP